MSERPRRPISGAGSDPDSHDHALWSADRAADAWQEFIVNGQPSALASYLSAGGQVDDTVRAALIDLLSNDRRGNPGGGKPYRDLETFIRVNWMLTLDKARRRPLWQNGQGMRPLDKTMSRRKALQHYAENTGQELRTVELQYKRGKRICEEFK